MTIISRRIEMWGIPITLAGEVYVRLPGDQRIDVPVTLVAVGPYKEPHLRMDFRAVQEAIQSD